MHYPYKAEPIASFGFGIAESAVCNETCANAAGFLIADELTDGWIEATDEARCPACGRLLVIGGALTWAHYDANREAESRELARHHYEAALRIEHRRD